MAISFGDGLACDYSISCKDHIVKKNIFLVEEHLQAKVLKAVVEDCYVDYGNAMLNNSDNIKKYQDAIKMVLGRGGFRIKGFETLAGGGEMKYLGVTWCKDDDTYKLKFRLNLGRIDRGKRLDPDLTEEAVEKMVDVSWRDLLGLTCQFYDPAGLGTPLIMGLRIIQSRVCNTMTTGMKKFVEAGESEGVRSAVKEMIKGREIKFPRQIIYGGKAEIIICFDGSLTAYGAAPYVVGLGGANLLTSVGKDVRRCVGHQVV